MRRDSSAGEGRAAEDGAEFLGDHADRLGSSVGVLPNMGFGSAPAVPRRYLRSGNPLRRSKKALESGRAHRRARAGAIMRAGKIAPRRLAAGARSMVLLATLSHAQTSVAQRTRWHDARSASGRAAPCKTCSRGRPRAATSWCSRCHTRYRQVPLRLARPARSSDSERWRGAIARALLARSCDVHGAHRKPQRFRTAGRRLSGARRRVLCARPRLSGPSTV